MPRRVLLQGESGTVDLVETPAPNEHHLQEVIKANPQLIPAEDLGIDGDLLVVGRETTLASGSIDLLCVSRAGEIVLVEFKTGPQNPDFRAALAQLLDYGSDLWRLGLAEFDAIVQRYVRSERVSAEFRGANDLDEIVARGNWALGDEDRDLFRSRIAEVLATGDFVYVVASQRFTEAMRSTLEYLNATMRYGQFFLVEVVQLVGSSMSAHAAQVVARPSRKSSAASPGGSSAARTNADFLAELPDERFREAMGQVLDACSTLGLLMVWRSRGASIRFTTPDGRPLSIGWALPPGGQWNGARDLTLGFDPASSKVTPGVEESVRRFAEAVGAIPGAIRATSGIVAYRFDVNTLPNVVAEVVRCLEDFVADSQTRLG